MNGSIKTRLDEKAYERDGYRCVDCGKDTGIEAHHIIYEEELDNLVTLCHSCHKKEHGLSGCFKKGYDPRRNLEALKLGSPIGHPCRNRKYANP